MYLTTLYANYKLAKIENLKRGRLGIYNLYNIHKYAPFSQIMDCLTNLKIGGTLKFGVP